MPDGTVEGGGAPPGRRAFIAGTAAAAVGAAAVAAGVAAGRSGDDPQSVARLAADLTAHLAEAHDPRAYGAFWNGRSHSVGSSADSTGSRGPYLTVAAAQGDLPWVTSLDDEWDWVALTAAAEHAVEHQAAVRLPGGTAVINRPWRPPSSVSVFGSGIDVTVLRLTHAGQLAFGEPAIAYRHGYLGDFTIDGTASDAPAALTVGFIVETVCGPIRVSGAGADGVHVVNAQNCEFWSWQVTNCPGTGLVIDGGAQNLEFSNATIKRNGGSNIHIRRTPDLEPPDTISEVPRLIRFRGGLSEGLRADGTDCILITAGIDITFDGTQTSVGDGRPNSAAVRIRHERPHALQLIRLRGVQLKADDGVGLVVDARTAVPPVQLFVTEPNFRTGSAAMRVDDITDLHVSPYYLGDAVDRLGAIATHKVGAWRLWDDGVNLRAKRGTPRNSTDGTIIA
jgi:hypothetical protein